MTDSSTALSDGIEYIPATPENSPLETTTQEEPTTELFLNMAPLHQLAAGNKVAIPRSKNFSRKDVVNAFQAAFDLIGGVPRLALWANANETEFFKLYSKMLPSQASSALGESNELRLTLAIAPSALDAPAPAKEVA